MRANKMTRQRWRRLVISVCLISMILLVLTLLLANVQIRGAWLLSGPLPTPTTAIQAPLR